MAAMRNFMSLLLVLSILGLSGSLFAEKKGADLIIQKKDGQQIQRYRRGIKHPLKNGNLIFVSQNTKDK